ncbi:MXAN_5187 C-terminal domain-containing protein [Anaeromyxobacter oryzae]|uniref:Uncharacterized protein n=1 Tax=Anaeromyxobacter oryzae TaxID=2918170 RepID=A0ABN6MUJ7_9BACT|nr:MXAN_5187 C-terminal domain-containing protein [Anaeromyxobacter oryzae]BDG03532.1 hypothetical protein AMOR_25280 [Anaeromyxobacter oryzae]
MPLPPQKPPGRPGLAPSAEEQAQARRHQTDELGDEAQRIEEELEALKARYEQYFLGVERREPAKWRDDVKKKVLRLKGAFTRNTGLKFKIQSLHARYLSYERLWLRSAREKEEGTYRRDVFKARLRSRDPEAAPAPDAPSAAAAPAASATATSAAPPAPPAAKPAAPASPSVKPTASAAASDPQLRALYDAYIAAKKRCNEDVSKLTYDAVARSVSKQVPELIAKYKAKSVDFKVEVRDGKAVLKAIPKL